MRVGDREGFRREGRAEIAAGSVFDPRVRGFGKSEEFVLAPLACEIECERAFPAMLRPEFETALGADDIVGVRAHAARGDTAGWLDQDHLGAELGEDLAGEASAAVGEVEDTEVGEEGVAHGPMVLRSRTNPDGRSSRAGRQMG